MIQSMLTMNHFKLPQTAETVQSVMAAASARGIEFVGGRILNPPAAAGGGPATRLTADERGAVDRGATLYSESCFACHGEDGRGAPQPGGTGLRAPALAGSSRVTGHRDYVIGALLHGLTGPVEGRPSAEVMPAMGASSDPWLADIASFIRNSFGNAAPIVTPADVARLRTATAGRTAPWTVAGLIAILPRTLILDAAWRATASHNSDGAAGAFDFTRWTSGAPQEQGMWFQVELPESVALTEIQFASQIAGGGRGGGPVVATAPRGYRVDVSLDGTAWKGPVAEGQGGGRTTTITFAPVAAKFVRITQTARATDAPAWTMERLRLYERPEAQPPR